VCGPRSSELALTLLKSGEDPVVLAATVEKDWQRGRYS